MGFLSSSWIRHADRLGLTAGIFCAVHCALVPVLLAVLPAVGGWAIGWERLHMPLVGFLTALALGATWVGSRRHRRFYAWAFVLPGLAFVWIGGAAESTSMLWSAVAMATGGTLVVCGHALNLKLAHGHLHDAQCGHC